MVYAEFVPRTLCRSAVRLAKQNWGKRDEIAENAPGDYLFYNLKPKILQSVKDTLKSGRAG